MNDGRKHSYFDEIDWIARWHAQANGEPLPEVVLSPALQEMIDLVERTFGIRVLARPHTFLSGHLGLAAWNDHVVTIFCHPDFPEIESRRILGHEGGHWDQFSEGYFKETDTIDEMIDYENDADARGYRKAEEWGMGDLYPEEYRRERLHLHQQVLEALQGLSYATGIKSATILMEIALRLLYYSDEAVGTRLKRLAGKSVPLTWRELGDICYNHPEWVVGFDRSAMITALSINRGRSSQDNLCKVRYPVKASQLLHSLLTGRSSYGQARNDRLMVNDRGRQMRFAWFDGKHTLGTFLREVQAEILRGSGNAASISWEYTIDAGLTVYMISIDWDEQAKDIPDIRFYWRFGKEDRRSDPRYEQALRLFVNGFATKCAVSERPLYELIPSILWYLLGSDDRPRKIRGPEEIQRDNSRQWNARVEAAVEQLSIVRNPDPRALFEGTPSGFQIWATPDDRPPGWEDVLMDQGGFSKPCALVATVYYRNVEDSRIYLETDAAETGDYDPRHPRRYLNRPADIAWALSKMEMLFAQAGVEARPIVIGDRNA